MNPTKLQKDLDEIMENGLQKVHMPYVKGKGKSRTQYSENPKKMVDICCLMLVPINE